MESVTYNIAKFFHGLISIECLIMGIVMYFYGSAIKSNLIEDSFNQGMPINSWDISLNLLCDMYIIVYFVIPLVLFISTISILKGFNYQTLIRLGSYRRWVYFSLKNFWRQSSLLLFIWIFMAIFMVIGVPFSWNWSLFSQSDSMFNTLKELTSIFHTPLSTFFIQVILLFITFSLLHTILLLLYVTTKSKNLILIICAIVFLGGMAGFKLLPKELAFLSPSTYFSITKYMDSFNSPFLALGIMLAFSILCFLYFQLLDINKKIFFQSLKMNVPLLIYVFLCILGIVSTAANLKTNENTILDVWIMSFRGSSLETFIYAPFFYYCIVFFGFVYIVNVRLSEEIDRMGYYKIIRFKNLERWFWSWFYKILIKAVLLLVFLTVLSICTAVVMGMNLNFNITVFNQPLYKVFYHFFMNGFLQITFYLLSIFIVAWVSKESIHGVILISIFMILMLPIVSQLNVIPVGLNSLVYMENLSLLNITLILLVSNILAYLVIKYLFTKSLKI
ncbi:hypothetical protein ACFRH9_28665 [Peribacillus butanolivorans]|uniref:hypothetical protein n=1 Tax=Peribacillus butanolivorans TaxID=421767 RepID=UPI003670318B